MGQKMARGTGLTARQKQLLEFIVQEPYIIKNFYLTGGTALSSWYLFHRESFDLDFFSQAPFNYDYLRRYFHNLQDTINASISTDEDYGFMSIHLRYPDNDRLKVDFNHYSSIRIKKGITWKGLEIDSLEDIATNKLDTIYSHPRTRDYTDLYYLFEKHPYQLNHLISNASRKFREDIDPLKLAKNFLKVSEYSDYPKMLVPFEPKKMEAFYEHLAGSLRNQIFSD